jgi:ABC-type transport system substrate-binding protein
MALLGWSGDNGDPDNFLYVLLDKTSAKSPAQNIAFYRSDALHKVLVDAKTTSALGKRKSLYKKAQEIIHKDAPWVNLAHSVVVVPLHKRVMNFVLDPTGKRRFSKVWLKK